MKGWRVRHLVGAWIAYWAGLGLVTLGSTAFQLWKLSQTNAKGDATVSFGDGALRIVAHNGPVIFADKSVSLIAAALWISLPPLMLWAIWMWLRPARSPIVTGTDMLDDGAMLTDDHSRALVRPPEERPVVMQRDQSLIHRPRDND